MSAARPEILAIVLAAADELNTDLDTPIALDRGEDTVLYGREGVLDSLGLVSLVAAIEEGVQNRLGATVVLADERAVSQRESPFRTVGTLVDYIQAQL